MRSSFIFVAVLAAAVSAARCGGGGGGGGGGQPPLTGPGAGQSTVTVSIVGTKGNGSFVPNPVTKSGADLVTFKNNDTVVHHIVMDDGSADFGDLAPGATSQAKAVFGRLVTGASNQPQAVGNGNFHCKNHPSMVGSIGGTVAPDPPPGSGDGY